eukprot:6225913-Karenia_brevis.AAC.1
MSKVTSDIIDDHFDPVYCASVPNEQCGAVAKRGSDLANLMLRCLVDYALLMGWAVAIIFIDLIKAFDTIIRELAIGWPQFSCDDRIGYLCSIGLSAAHAADVTRDIENNGSVLHQLGCHPHIIELLRSLHSNTWFKHGDCEEAIISRKGVRQGCRFGSKIFNLLYGKALRK